ncbi:hypothetical protein D0Y65_018316 [Glycine soja]|uniref:Uncharacterized protein n=1 Tax=Glycine soja TaxID=3848 RepID=A0A445JYK6_GLYSO|nr:hypothetical protein D0Y65_018316 [Glycine soja]
MDQTTKKLIKGVLKNTNNPKLAWHLVKHVLSSPPSSSSTTTTHTQHLVTITSYNPHPRHRQNAPHSTPFPHFHDPSPHPVGPRRRGHYTLEVPQSPIPIAPSFSSPL